MNEPAPVPQPEPVNRGSLLLGVGCAWGLLLGGYAVVAAILLPGHVDGGTATLLLMLPWAAMIALIVWFATNGRPRSAGGVMIGIGSIFGVLLLLVAACFGLFANNWH
jgi:hypothetical protein